MTCKCNGAVCQCPGQLSAEHLVIILSDALHVAKLALRQHEHSGSMEGTAYRAIEIALKQANQAAR